eukprot:6954978-Prymnesium_polylepis.1
MLDHRAGRLHDPEAPRAALARGAQRRSSSIGRGWPPAAATAPHAGSGKRTTTNAWSSRQSGAIVSLRLSELTCS